MADSFSKKENNKKKKSTKTTRKKQRDAKSVNRLITKVRVLTR